MKKTDKTKQNNRLILIAFLLLIVVCIGIMVYRHVKKNNQVTSKPSISETTTQSPTQSILPPTTAVPETTEENTATGDLPEITNSNILFIGDSRTVGISEYAQLSSVDFFCDVGMSVYNIAKKTLSVENVGKVTLDQLLSNKKYGKIFIMLGINEVGYNMNTTTKRYKELVDSILEKQPEAVVFIESNLHVTKARSEKDDVVNNKNLDLLNSKIRELADGKRVFYIDSNQLFNDGNGNLAEDKTGDNAHLYAKYYKQWGEWILQESDKVYKEK